MINMMELEATRASYKALVQKLEGEVKLLDKALESNESLKLFNNTQWSEGHQEITATEVHSLLRSKKDSLRYWKRAGYNKFVHAVQEANDTGEQERYEAYISEQKAQDSQKATRLGNIGSWMVLISLGCVLATIGTLTFISLNPGMRLTNEAKVIGGLIISGSVAIMINGRTKLRKAHYLLSC